MKLMKRTNTYKANNVSFNPETISAYSYGWWKFVGVVEGVVIFNNHRYSTTTSGHQAKVRRLMNELGIKIDVELPLMEGLPGTYKRYGQEQNAVTLEQIYLAAEEELCRDFLKQEEKKIIRAEKAKEKREKRDAEFKANLDSITYEDVVALRASKLPTQL